jgi:gamma-glutamyl:cysteine ligase YbdK (ATP-grasp superfamily)
MSRVLGLFEGYGVELEYMIVDRETLNVLPVADEVLRQVAGDYTSEVELGEIAWCNEVVLHVIEIKTNGPASRLEHLPKEFLENSRRINRILESYGGMLLPTAMHPWMNPLKETKLWPHEYSPVYDSYNRIFGCQGHGWSNLQSLHINLPFDGDEEFGRLHAAIRLLLPILPAIAASSPVLDGEVNGFLDNRLEVYRLNQAKIPSITGQVIPEPVFDRASYENRIFELIYKDIRPYDTESILQYEWLNSRGAIARFSRNTIEIRVLDIQESPLADLAVYAFIIEVLKALVNERWISWEEQKKWSAGTLASIFLSTIRKAGNALIEEPEYMRVFGITGVRPFTTQELWNHLYSELIEPFSELEIWKKPLKHILQNGCLAERILRALGQVYSPKDLKLVYQDLADCLESGGLFGETD